MRTEDLSSEEVFKQFSIEMYEWNVLCIELENDDSQDEKQKYQSIKGKLDEIFLEYLTIRKRSTGRQAGYDFSTAHPEYNPETNEILSSVVEGNKAYIEVQETVGFKRKLRYTLHKKKDGWRIDKREHFDEFENKWRSEGI
jgi:hypothetical protein